MIENTTGIDKEIKQRELVLEVGTMIAADFFSNNASVKLPDYQRPYVWNEDKIQQLLQDFNDHFFNAGGYNPDALHYYLGCVLLYKKNDTEYEVIDGQQRITTLLILNHAWSLGESYLSQNKWNLSYSSMLSSSAIINNYKYLKGNEDSNIKNHLETIFSKLVFTVIKTNSEDEAFTFFDSQNSRGVSLSPVDFLKSYHLRELKAKEDLQRTFAKQWDSNNKGQFLNELFNLILWRSRNWKGHELSGESKDSILNTFQKQTIKEDDNDFIRLYPNVFNALADQLTYDTESGVCIQPGVLNLQTKAAQYPFSIRQPIQKGIGFFLYTEKYFAIYTDLFVAKKNKPFLLIYNKLIERNSSYLKAFFKLSSIVYYDKFKDNKLVEFALWMDYMLGSYRINQRTIVAQTVIKILREKNQNLLDVIEMAYRPEDVFAFIRSATDVNHYNANLEKDAENGVRNIYLKANLEFFKNYNDGKLTHKKSWINGYLKNI